MNSNRSEYLDIVKGVAIFFVLWGHSLQYFSFVSSDDTSFFDNTMFQFIYSFHMPLFMLVSGYLTKSLVERSKFLEFVKKRAKGLGIPMLTWGCVCGVIIYDTSIGKNITLGMVKGGFFSLWFLWSVLLLSGVYVFTDMVKNSYAKVIILLVAMLLVYKLPKGVLNIYMLPYFLVGFYVRKHKDYIENKIYSARTFVLAGGTTVLFIVLFQSFNYDSFIYTTGINPFRSKIGALYQVYVDIYRYIIGFVGSGMVMLLIKIAYDKKVIDGVVKDGLVHLGKISLQIYAVQHVILEMVAAGWFRSLVDGTGYNPLIQNIYVFNFVITPLIAMMFAVVIARFVVKDLLTCP